MMPLRNTWQKWKEQEDNVNGSLMIWETEDNWELMLMFEKCGNDSLSHKHKEEIQ